MGFATRYIEEAPPRCRNWDRREVVFISMAYNYQSRVLGVLLTEGRTDGVKGLCIVQDPEEAQDTSMPYQILREDHNDVIASLDTLPRLLETLARGSTVEAVVNSFFPVRTWRATAQANSTVQV
jgi:chemotaxis response regulator CheB